MLHSCVSLSLSSLSPAGSRCAAHCQPMSSHLLQGVGHETARGGELKILIKEGSGSHDNEESQGCCCCWLYPARAGTHGAPNRKLGTWTRSSLSLFFSRRQAIPLPAPVPSFRVVFKGDAVSHRLDLFSRLAESRDCRRRLTDAEDGSRLCVSSRRRRRRRRLLRQETVRELGRLL